MPLAQGSEVRGKSHSLILEGRHLVSDTYNMTNYARSWFHLLWGASQPRAGAMSCPPTTHAGRKDALEPQQSVT